MLGFCYRVIVLGSDQISLAKWILNIMFIICSDWVSSKSK